MTERRVTVQPAGHVFETEDGEPIMRAATRLGYRWPTTCNGDASCTVCFVEVVEGDEHLDAMSALEATGLDGFPGKRFYKGTVRLACQLTISGPVVVNKKAVQPPGA